MGRPTPFRPLRCRCWRCCCRSHPLGQCQLFSSAKNSRQHTHTHAHKRIAKQLQSLSLLLKSFVLFLFAFFSVRHWRRLAAQQDQIRTRDPPPPLTRSLSIFLSHSLAESELCSQQFIENIFVVSKQKKNVEVAAKLCSIFISTSNASYFWHLCMYSYSYRYKLRPPLGLAFTAVRGSWPEPWPSNAEDQQSTRFQ